MAKKKHSDERVERLIEILRYRRPDQSHTEAQFINSLLNPLGVIKDEFGNLIKRIGTAPIMWSCHTDTVHRFDGMQKVVYDRKKNEIKLPAKSISNCLGADCGTGVWLMSEMIRAGVEGLYIFHRAEEIGGLGSTWITKNTPQVVEGIQYAIAFDRYGTESIITHQCGRCCSDAFAWQLGAKLGDNMTPDQGGIYTDTAEYVSLIPECTNVSVGYEGHHTKWETQDVGFAIKLLDNLCSADFTDLVVERDVNDVPDYGYGWGRTDYSGAYSSPYGGYDDGYDDPNQMGDAFGRYPYKEDNTTSVNLYDDTYTDLVRKYPKVAAQIIYDFGVSKNQFVEEIYKQTGSFEQGAITEDDGKSPV